MEIGKSKTVKVVGNDGEFGRITFEVIESGAFAYGNRTAVVVTFTGKDGHENTTYFDTRYFVGTLDDFVECYYEENVRKDLHFEEA